MKTCIKCEQQKEIDSFSVSRAKKDGRHPICKDCDRARRNASRLTNIEQERAKDNARYAGRRTEKRAYDRGYYAQNREHLQHKAIAYYAANTEKVRATVARYQAINREKLRPFYAARARKYQTSKVNATPHWSEVKAIREKYIEAKFLSDITGDVYHVDHIVPLQSKYVCGLHVVANLQILRRLENIVKSNRTWPDMWEPV